MKILRNIILTVESIYNDLKLILGFYIFFNLICLLVCVSHDDATSLLVPCIM